MNLTEDTLAEYVYYDLVCSGIFHQSTDLADVPLFARLFVRLFVRLLCSDVLLYITGLLDQNNTSVNSFCLFTNVLL